MPTRLAAMTPAPRTSTKRLDLLMARRPNSGWAAPNTVCMTATHRLAARYETPH